MSQDGKSLLDKLQRPLTPGSSDSLTASANYSKAVHHVLDVIHEVLHHQRQLENIWQHRKVRLHQRLQLCVFQQDVQQVSGGSPRGGTWCWASRERWIAFSRGTWSAISRAGLSPPDLLGSGLELPSTVETLLPVNLHESGI